MRLRNGSASSGGAITADSLASACALAAQYGMGEITSSMDEPKRAPVKIRTGKFAAWCDLRQSAVTVGTLAEAAQAAYDDMDLSVVFYDNGPKKLNRAESAAVKKMMGDAE